MFIDFCKFNVLKVVCFVSGLQQQQKHYSEKYILTMKFNKKTIPIRFYIWVSLSRNLLSRENGCPSYVKRNASATKRIIRDGEGLRFIVAFPEKPKAQVHHWYSLDVIRPGSMVRGLLPAIRKVPVGRSHPAFCGRQPSCRVGHVAGKKRKIH